MCHEGLSGHWLSNEFGSQGEKGRVFFLYIIFLMSRTYRRIEEVSLSGCMSVRLSLRSLEPSEPSERKRERERERERGEGRGERERERERERATHNCTPPQPHLFFLDFISLLHFSPPAVLPALPPSPFPATQPCRLLWSGKDRCDMQKRSPSA